MIFFFFFFFFFRLVSLYISIKNEKRIKAKGGVEIGKFNSILLTVIHVFYYISSLSEGYLNATDFDNVSIIGVCLLIFSYTMLFYVIYQLKEIWTVKIYILPEHKLVRTFLFRVIRHPNYFLNIIPELIGIGLLCHSWKTMSVGLPIYASILIVRIYQEEKAMKNLYDKSSSCS